MTQTQTEIENSTVPTADRSILAFLGRNSSRRSIDPRLAGMLEHPLSQQIAEAMLNPGQPPKTVAVGRKAKRLFLDSGNTKMARQLDRQITALQKTQQHAL